LIQKDYLELWSNIQASETGDLVNQYIQQFNYFLVFFFSMWDI